MSTNDFFNPPDLHHILAPTRAQARREPRHTELRARRRRGMQKESRVKSGRQIKNPLYSRALDASGVNDGHQGKTLNGVGIPQTGHMFSGAYTYPSMGTGNP